MQVVSARLRRCLDGVSSRTGVTVAATAGGVTTLTPAGMTGLPATARSLLAPWHDPPVTVTARGVRQQDEVAGYKSFA